MAEPFISEIRIFSFNYPPKGWALCDGQTLPISQNQALFSLMGTYYGGNGIQTFQLPDLQGRAPMHYTSNNDLGINGGEVTHTLVTSEMPSHAHALQAKNVAATVTSPTGALLANPASGVGSSYADLSPNTTMAPQSIGAYGGNQPHNNMQPYVTLSYCIALQGIFPSRN